jgi:hypothetical protein
MGCGICDSSGRSLPFFDPRKSWRKTVTIKQQIVIELAGTILNVLKGSVPRSSLDKPDIIYVVIGPPRLCLQTPSCPQGWQVAHTVRAATFVVA